MNIAVITYDIPHRKTQDVLFRLKALGYAHVKAFALPFIKRKKFIPLYQHRPNNPIDIHPQNFCENLDFFYEKVFVKELQEAFELENPDYILIAGAGLLPEQLVENHKIINAHPGWLPNVRGLDALKWAIYNQEIIGITSHIINNDTDAGLLIERKKVDLFKNDTFHAVAYRQYELEIEMLVSSIEILEQYPNLEPLSTEISEPTRRMPKDLEQELMHKFEDYLSFISKK